jgi:hypothetical protein
MLELQVLQIILVYVSQDITVLQDQPVQLKVLVQHVPTVLLPKVKMELLAALVHQESIVPIVVWLKV